MSISVLENSGVHTRTLKARSYVSNDSPQGNKTGSFFFRVDNVVVIKLQDNCIVSFETTR